MEDVNSIAWPDGVIGWDDDSGLDTVEGAGEADEPFFGARCIALCDGHGVFNDEAVGERVLTRACYLAEDVKGSVGDNFCGDLRIPDVLAAESAGDLAVNFGGGEAAAADLSDERDRDGAGGADGIDVRQVLLSEHDLADAVARIQRIGGMGHNGYAGRRASGAGG